MTSHGKTGVSGWVTNKCIGIWVRVSHSELADVLTDLGLINYDTWNNDGCL